MSCLLPRKCLFFSNAITLEAFLFISSFSVAITARQCEYILWLQDVLIHPHMSRLHISLDWVLPEPNRLLSPPVSKTHRKQVITAQVETRTRPPHKLVQFSMLQKYSLQGCISIHMFHSFLIGSNSLPFSHPLNA